MARELVVVGAGGFGREVLDVVDAINAAGAEATWHVSGVVDDNLTPVNAERLAARGVPHIGGMAALLSRDADQRPAYVVGIGAPSTRRAIAERLDAAGLTAATLVHPTVTTGFGVTVGAGGVLCAGVRLTTNITLGRHVHLNLNVTVGHDTTLADYVSVNPLGSISGDCTIETGVLVGVGGVVLNGVTVHENATVGGSACVVREVESGQTVVGIPARPIVRRES